MKSASKTLKYWPIDLGPLPVEAINAVLGTELDPGRVRLTARAHQHMAEDHADDYDICIAALKFTVTQPHLIGHAPKRIGNFELLRRVNHPNGKVVLAAVSLEGDADGCYRVASCYLVSGKTVDNRRLAGRLKPPPPK